MSAQVIEQVATQQKSNGLFGSLLKPLISWYIPTSRAEAEAAEQRILIAGNLRVNKDSQFSTGIISPNDNSSDNSPIVNKNNGPEAILGNVYIDEENYIRTLLIKGKKSRDMSNIDNTIVTSAVTPHQENDTLVITHGYATALGFYFKNYEELSKIPSLDVAAIDWLGMGLSARPEFKIDKKLEIKEQIKITEEFFVESLEKWRIKMQIEKMTLLGHSFGGYMSSLYALKYPERVNKLILESPVGVQKTPESIDEFVLTGDFSKLEDAPLPQKQPETPQEFKEARYAAIQQRMKDMGPQYKFLVKSAINSWNNYSSPQAFVRYFGRFGPDLVNRYVGSFRALSEDDRQVLSNYMYHISVQRGSSEYAMGIILKPMAFAREPLLNRIDRLKVPTVFMYGENDWMDSDAGIDVASRIEAPTKLYTIPNAGHNMHLDNPKAFNKAMEEIITSKI